MGLPSYEPQRKFVSGLRICVPENRIQFTFPGQGYPLLGKEQGSGNVRSALTEGGVDRKRPLGFVSLSHGSAPLAIHWLLGIEGRVGQFRLTVALKVRG